MVQIIFYVKLLHIYKIRYFSSILNVSADTIEKHEFFQPGVVQQTPLSGGMTKAKIVHTRCVKVLRLTILTGKHVI
jgi:hypothetical protein